VARRRKRQEIKITLRLYPGQDDELIHWLDQFDDQPHGAKSKAIKEAFLRGISVALDQPAPSAPVLDLAGLRQVVEAAIAQALARFEGQMGAGAAALAPADDDETEALLDNLGAALVVADEE
jgi:hypothetical protein